MAGHARIDNRIYDEFGPKIGCIGIALYSLLVRYSDRNGRCFPALKTICETLKITRPTAIKFLKTLEDEGLITHENQRGERGTFGSNSYRVNLFNTVVSAGTVEGQSEAHRVNVVYTVRVNDVSAPCKPRLHHRVNVVDTNNTHGEQDPMNKEVLPSGVVAPAETTPPAKGKPPPQRNVPDTAHHQLLAAYQDALGYPLPNGAQEAKGAKNILKQNYTQEQILDCYRHLRDDPFYEGKHISLQMVHRQIGAFLQAKVKNDGTERHSENRSRRGQSQNGRAGRKPDPLAGITVEQRAAEDRYWAEFWEQPSGK